LKIKDIVFGSILYIANKFLIEIANTIGEDTIEIEGRPSRVQQNFYKYFYNSSSSNNKEEDSSAKLGSDEENLFYDYDHVQKSR
jgi:hypothetical protein